VLKRKKFLIGGVIVFLAIGYLAYMGFMGWATYSYTVGELKELGSSIQGNSVRVSGQVALGSVTQEPDNITLQFTIVEDGESLPVVYQGVVPDTFKVGNDIVVEGHLNSNGIFQANTILVKCPSKYVPRN